jgi:hypothetical protein
VLLQPGAVPLRRHTHQNAPARPPFAGGLLFVITDFEYQGEKKKIEF